MDSKQICTMISWTAVEFVNNMFAVKFRFLPDFSID